MSVSTLMPWWQSRILERVGKVLGVKLGRHHYFTPILVERAVNEMLQTLKTHPEHGAAIRAICDEEESRTAKGRRHRVLGMIATGPASHHSLAHLVGDEAADILYEFLRLNKRSEFESLLRAITDASYVVTIDGVWTGARARLSRSRKPL